MANKQLIRTNSKHGGKEFKNYFQFIGKVEKTSKFQDGQSIQQPFFDTTKTKSTGKPRRVFQFDIYTNKYNRVKVERAGQEFEQANLYSSSEKKSVKIDWKDRHDKSKYPNDTYHLLDTDWDKAAEFANIIEEGMWVEVKGRYEFDTLINEEGKETHIVKRIATQITPLEELLKNDKYYNKDYVMDFDSDDFKEVNYFNLQLGIKSTYQFEDKNTKVNAIFLANGKTRSEPKDVELMVYYKEPEVGKMSLSDAIASLGRLDFVEVIGLDNNRPEFSEVDDAEFDEDDPFALAEGVVAKKRSAISGNRRGLEITSVVKGTVIRGLLTEEEISKTVSIETEDPFSNFNSLPNDLPNEELPFDLD